MHVLIGISGGIAAYKIPELIRLFIKAGAEVKVAVSKNALEFVTPLTLETLSKNRIYSDTFAPVNDYATEHISLSEWADIFIVAPATADVIGKFANGIADDALTTTYISYTGHAFIAPAMNNRMYENSTVQRNIAMLVSSGAAIIGPAAGDLACGTTGRGRMEEPAEIFRIVSENLLKQKPWSGKKILITAGPTYERIDPVRFIGNYSSGKMGFALAEACAKRGAEVCLISGPVDLQVGNPSICRINVESASQMYEESLNHFPDMDAAILCAAVADFTPENVVASKVKRGDEDLMLRLKPTKDIAAALGTIKKDNQALVGFALETDEEENNAKAKLEKKNLDFIVLNSLKDEGAGFRHDTNKIRIYDRDGYMFDYPLKSKNEVAEDILDILNNYINK